MRELNSVVAKTNSEVDGELERKDERTKYMSPSMIDNPHVTLNDM